MAKCALLRLGRKNFQDMFTISVMLYVAVKERCQTVQWEITATVNCGTDLFELDAVGVHEK